MLGFNKSGLALGNKRVKMKMSSPHESRSVVLYSVVVFNQSGEAIVNTSTDRGCARFWQVWLGSR